MPTGVIWLAAGTLIGIPLGWLIFDNPVMGGAVGFVFALLYLLIASWMDHPEDGK